MLKKRIIFTLLYDRGFFMLSRNFRLQKVGDIKWLQKNYNFSQISFSIDELIVLDVSRDAYDQEKFREHLRILTEGCFTPIAAGGGIRTLAHAQTLLRSGADKVVVNTLIGENPQIIQEIASEFGEQCVIAAVDVKEVEGQFTVWTDNGTKKAADNLQPWLELIAEMPIGELYLNSIDRDGTGQGYKLELLDSLPETFPIPVIIAGGAGNHNHLSQGLKIDMVDAVATAHLFNFIGDGLVQSRNCLYEEKFDLAMWDAKRTNGLRDCLIP